MNFQRTCYPWISWFLPAFSFLVMYVARVAPASFLNELIDSFHVNHAALGVLGSAFLQGYVVMQIPVGMLVDRFGPVKLLLIASIIGIIGNNMFVVSTTLAQAHFARMLFGVGSAFIFVCAYKQAKIWLSPRHFPMACGFTQVFGMLGGAIGAGMMHRPGISWRVTMNMVTQLWCLLVILMLIFLRSKREDSPRANHSHNIKEMFKGLKTVLINKNAWCNGLYAGLIFLPTEVLGGWWGPYYLGMIHNLDKAQSGALISSIFVGWAIGGSLIGYISGRWNATKQLMIASSMMSLLLLCIGMYARGCPFYLLNIVFFLFGLCNTGLIIAYALSADFVGIEVAGSAVAFTNIMSIILGIGMQPIIGFGVTVLTVYFNENVAFDMVMFLLPLCLLMSAYMGYVLRIPKKNVL